MIFYEISARKSNASKEEDNKKKYRELTDILCEKWDDRVLVVLRDVSEVTCILNVAIQSDAIAEYSVNTICEEVGKLLGQTLTIKRRGEVSIRHFIRSLQRAEREDYLEDADKIITDLRLKCNFSYQEYIAGKVSREEVTEKVRELLYDKSFSPELDRIYHSHPTTDQLHHPVHYIIRSDDEEDAREVLECLISALYENHRLFSRRYTRLSIDEYTDREDFNSLYTLQQGATVVLEVVVERNTDGICGKSRVCEAIEWLTANINRFHQNVLTVFILPQVCDKETETIYRNVEPLFVELFPENATGDRAISYLNYKAQKANVLVTESLYQGIARDKAYTCRDLTNHFAGWYSNYVRNEMYPQYAALQKKKPSENENRFGKALKELDEMIGLGNVKQTIYHALDYYKVQKMYQTVGKKKQSPSMHMVFTGNPGTAKTTVARLFAQILKDNNIIKNGQLVEVGRADLVGKYVGNTAPMVRRAFEKAAGGVLFIDEAYSLLEYHSGSYGDEAINTIVQEMENRRNETIVIFAGYPNEMEQFIARNPGLKSRIAFHVPFSDYTAEELLEITKIMAKNGENQIDEAAFDKLNKLYQNAVKSDDFGNGRYARNTIEKAEMNRASRLAKLDFDEVTPEMLATFLPEDFIEEEKQTKPERKIGFLSAL